MLPFPVNRGLRLVRAVFYFSSISPSLSFPDQSHDSILQTLLSCQYLFLSRSIIKNCKNKIVVKKYTTGKALVYSVSTYVSLFIYGGVRLTVPQTWWETQRLRDLMGDSE